jgi:hypothetical protein
MSRPPTMVIREADERTLVDPRFSLADPLSDATTFFVEPSRLSDPEPPFEGSGRAISSDGHRPPLEERTEETQSPLQRARAKLLQSGRGMTRTGVVFALVLGLGSVAYQQWRVVAALRETIDQMKADGSEPFVQDLFGSAGRGLAPAENEMRLEGSAREVAASEREAMELRGASLIGSNNFLDALTHYQMLTELFPNERAFRDVVTVLRAKLRCPGSADPMSRACP